MNCGKCRHSRGIRFGFSKLQCVLWSNLKGYAVYVFPYGSCDRYESERDSIKRENKSKLCPAGISREGCWYLGGHCHDCKKEDGNGNCISYK